MQLVYLIAMCTLQENVFIRHLKSCCMPCKVTASQCQKVQFWCRLCSQFLETIVTALVTMMDGCQGVLFFCYSSQAADYGNIIIFPQTVCTDQDTRRRNNPVGYSKTSIIQNVWDQVVGENCKITSLKYQFIPVKLLLHHFPNTPRNNYKTTALPLTLEPTWQSF